NLEKLIEAFSQFKQEMKEEVSLVLVGKDDYFYQRLRQKIKQEKLENILIKHNVNDEELFSLYSHARAFVSPSLMEGFGLPPLEAMSASCQVLLSDIPSFREVCQDAAWYFDPQIKQSLTQQMRFVYTSDHKIKEEKIRKGLERVKSFSWEKMAKETVQIYESSISI
ncbi:MAG TPA: glycosyltransferase family 1 protein, partial [Patescibacteria group bacterium]|nr:glycosyltransferase family 1 protein [Patescibacteria group bacterium]